ncbi:TonB-dependent receptor domain-containing protein, partial [Cobetia sp. Dlab-2-U]|uniref:TonB-dependent receptor domain-containing protein n=1 Tax=Cobetia sp. Dlab-2-U TaxID=2954489 RepID=UPI0020974385
GLELSARYEDASNQAGSISFAAGNSFDKGFLNAYGTYYTQTRNDRSDLGFIRDRILPLTSSTGQPGSYVQAVTDSTTGNISRFSTSTVPDPNCEAAGGILSGSRCRLDFSDQVSIIPEEDRFQFFSEGEYELADNVTFFGEASFSRNRVKRTQGPGLFQNGLVDNGAIFVPGDHPFNFFVADPSAAAGIRYVDPAEWDNAIHTGVDVVAIARPLGEELNGEGNADNRLISLDYWRGVAGLSFDLSDTWSADVSYQYAAGEREFNAPFNYIADNINQLALDGTWNPFGSAQGTPGLVSPKDGTSVAENADSVINQLSTTEITLHKSEQYTIDGVVTGDLFELPSGTVAAAFGAQYRAEEFSFTPDPLKAAAGSESRDPQFGASGEQDVYSFFGETIVPVTDALELQVALRFEDYGDQGGTTTDPKIALRYQPTEWLALRGSYGTSFQAPTARQTSAQVSRQVYDDPVSIDPGTGALVCGMGRTQISGELRVSGGDNLKPQSARNFNLGAVFSPASGL